MNKFYILTIASIGLFIGFWFGYYVFAQVHVKVICKPSGRVLLDTRRNLMYEITIGVDVSGCESIDFIIEKANPTEIIFGGGGQEEPEQLVSEQGEQGIEGGGAPQISEKQETQSKTPPAEAPQPPITTETTLVLEIFDICAGDIIISDYPEIVECLKMKPPYYVILEKDASNIKTSFYGGIGFNKTYSLSTSVLIFQIFVRDIATLSEDVQSIEIYGSIKPYFSIGSFSINDVLQEEEEILTIQKTMKNVRVLSFPIYVSENLPASAEWEELSFYLKTAQNLYFIGDVWFFST